MSKSPTERASDIVENWLVANDTTGLEGTDLISSLVDILATEFTIERQQLLERVRQLQTETRSVSDPIITVNPDPTTHSLKREIDDLITRLSNLEKTVRHNSSMVARMGKC